MPDVVFIASTAYSGSTLLSALLAMHPAIATVSDVSGTRRSRSMDTFRCSCGERMAACPFWLAVREAMLRRGVHSFDLADFRLGFDYAGRTVRGRLLTGSLGRRWLERARDRLAAGWPGHERRMRAIGVRNRAFAEAVLEVTGRRVFVDASKERLRARHLARYLGAPVRVIHLVRDVRGVVGSTIRHGKRPRDGPAGIARDWRSTHESILRDLAALPADRRTRVRYEDLCRDPDGTLRGLFRFCGVDPEAGPTGTAAGAPTTPHLLGNRVRLSGLGAIHLDERWRDELDERALGAIASAAGPTNAAFYGATE